MTTGGRTRRRYQYHPVVSAVGLRRRARHRRQSAIDCTNTAEILNSEADLGVPVPHACSGKQEPQKKGAL